MSIYINVYTYIYINIYIYISIHIFDVHLSLFSRVREGGTGGLLSMHHLPFPPPSSTPWVVLCGEGKRREDEEEGGRQKKVGEGALFLPARLPYSCPTCFLLSPNPPPLPPSLPPSLTHSPPNLPPEQAQWPIFSLGLKCSLQQKVCKN